MANEFKIKNGLYVSGSTTITNNTTITGSLVVNGGITGSLLGTASYATNAGLFNGLDSSVFALTSSLSAFSSSLNGFTSSINTYTASNNSSISNLNGATSSLFAATSSLFTYTASATLRINALDQYTASLNTRSASFACVNATNTFACAQYFSDASNASNFNSTASLYSDGGMRITKDLYVSGTSYFNNITVFGTQSVAYISSSQLNIGTNIISVNTDVPAIRFGGLAVYDSGSTGLTGSMLWDSQANHWVYSNPSGSTYSGGMFISGPRSAALGSEQGTTACRLLVGQGGDHLTSSMIYHDSTVTCVPNTLIGSTVCTTMTNAGCIGIGTTSPVSALDVNGRISLGGALFTNVAQTESSAGTLASGYNINLNSGSPVHQATGAVSGVWYDTVGVRFYTNSSQTANTAACERVRINSNGNVGIGTTNSSYPLFVHKAGPNVFGTVYNIASFNDGSAAFKGINLGYINNEQTGVIYAETAACKSNIAFWTYDGSWNERVRIACNGNVGIGTTSPTFALDVASTSADTLRLNRTGVGGTGSASSMSFQVTQTNAQSATLASISAEFMTNWGGDLRLYTKPANGTPNDSVTERMRITSAGFVGIGCTSPSYSLDINDTNGSGVRGMRISTSSSSVGPSIVLRYSPGGLTNWLVGTSQAVSHALEFVASCAFSGDPGVCGATRMMLTYGGQLGIGTTNTSAEANLFLGAQGSIEGGQMVFQKGTSCNCATHLDNYNDSFRIMSGTDTGSNMVNMTVNHATGTVGISKTLSITTTALHGIKTFESGATSAFTINLPVEYPNLLLTGGNVWGVVGKALFFNGGSAEVRDFYIARNSGGSWSTANYGPSSNTSGGILQSVAGSGTCITINMNSNSYVTVELTTMVR